MAEAVGLAASIAGPIGNTGQIAKTGLFIKGFLSDIKNAPDNIRSLAAEIESLSTAATKTEDILTKYKSLDTNVDFEAECEDLARFVDLLNESRNKIEEDATKFGTGKGRWWERLGSAVRKKEVAEVLLSVERAKTLVIGMELKILINHQYRHGDVLAHLSSDISSVRNDLCNIGPAIKGLSQARADEFSALDQMLDSVLQRGLQRHYQEFGAS
ncbi:uncharacterized protein RSE6_00915 [Rhynchosporium secalis]|uniref:Fungal N-terminal domain-containing protein n=1 Tax=Rhynchosporium secalis TaxID=38038 RepID=A0A1E1LWF5_RHYSE|nr:uncharacterized protein RSE6_00915 [Rhynchosporium secalis]